MNPSKLAHVLALGLAIYLCAGQPVSADPVSDWLALKDELQGDKKSLCNSQLAERGSAEFKLSVDKVGELFEMALDHVVRASNTMSKMEPLIKAEAVDEFYKSGSQLVLEISNNRRSLLADYSAARKSGADEPELEAILEKYFYKACAHKLGTQITENSLFSSMLKVEGMKRRRASRQ